MAMTGPDLSGVAVDGSHVIWVDTSTGRQFFSISGKNASAFTVTVNETIAGTTSGLNWAIGGKRATLAGSSELYDNGGAAGDLEAGWVVELASGFTETITTAINIRCSGTADNLIVIRGESGAVTKPVITNASDIDTFTPTGLRFHLLDFDVDKTGGTDNQGHLIGHVGAGDHFILENIKTTGASASNRWRYVVILSFDSYTVTIINCDFSHSWYDLIQVSRGVVVKGCKLREAGTCFIDAGGYASRIEITENEMYNSGSQGVKISNYGNVIIARNTVIDSGGDGIYTTTNEKSVIEANIVVNSGGYGINASASLYLWSSHGNLVYNSTSGISNNILNFTAASTVDPDFVDAAGGDVTPQTDLAGVAVASEFKPSTSYLYPGCIQPECVGGGGGSPQLINGGLIS
jgi:hypothetical protein